MAFSAACIQMNSQDDMAANIQNAAQHIREARDRGAEFISLPENAFLMEERGKVLWEKSTVFEDHPALHAMQTLTRELECWLLIGSLAVRTHDQDKLANRSVLLNPAGEVAAWYDKIHLFDVELAGDRRYDESRRFICGDRAVTAALPWGTLGITVCYDVRFPHLYRDLAKAGADFLTVPAAFTYTTGSAHWQVLLRARAIENACYVFAPAQCGHHPGNRRTYGHAMIAGPWGEVLAEASEDKEEVIIAAIDPEACGAARAQLPSLQHDRSYAHA